jgi:hypothetical protein
MSNIQTYKYTNNQTITMSILSTSYQIMNIPKCDFLLFECEENNFLVIYSTKKEKVMKAYTNTRHTIYMRTHPK